MVSPVYNFLIPKIGVRLKAHDRKEAGFTLVELLVVISIIAILSVVGMTVFTGIQKSARDSKRRADVDAIAKALETKHANTGSYGELNIYNDPENQGLFASGAPKDPSSEKYTIVKNESSGGFSICAGLRDSGVCSSTSQACFCKSSIQAEGPDSVNFTPVTNTELVAAACPLSSSQGLIGHWKMNGNTNSETGSYNGSLVGSSSWSGGILDQAISLAGSGRVNLPNTGSGPFPVNNFTVSFWVSPNTTSGIQSFWGYGRDGGSGRVNLRRVGSQWRVWFYWDSPEQLRSITGGTATANQWSMVTFIKNGTQDKLYVNGVQAGSTTNLTATAPDINAGGGSPVHYIGLGNGDAEGWNGLIDEVRFYNVVLDGATITSLYGNGLGCF